MTIFVAACWFWKKELVERTDEYAANRGVTFSNVVADALRLLMRKKSA